MSLRSTICWVSRSFYPTYILTFQSWPPHGGLKCRIFQLMKEKAYSARNFEPETLRKKHHFVFFTDGFRQFPGLADFKTS